MTGSAPVVNSERFWSANQPGVRFTDEQPGTPDFFTEVERERYGLEPHILEIAEFSRWGAQDVLEVGCGICTDGVNFARSGARYTGVDQSPMALELAARRFVLEDLHGSFVEAHADALPFSAKSFDLVYSHGVIHHMENTSGAVREFERVLRPGGTALVMLYHRHSFNYWVTIMTVRRAFALLVTVPGASQRIAHVTGERESVLEGHRALLRRYRLRYLMDSQLFLSNNTDGPHNPLSKVYTRREGSELFAGFSGVTTTVRHFNLRAYPGSRRLGRSAVAQRLALWWGWHLYIRATRSAASRTSTLDAMSASGETKAGAIEPHGS